MAALSAWAWENRVIVIAGPPGDETANRQRDELLGDEPGLVERDLVVLRLADDTVSVLFGTGPSPDAETLLSVTGLVGAQFGVALIGKDGTTKDVHHALVSRAALFGTIDAMPMRRAEMRE